LRWRGDRVYASGVAAASDPPVDPASGPGPSSDRPAPGTELTPVTIVAGIIVAIIMGCSYPYIVLKLGFGPNVSVVAAFFGFIVLSGFNMALRSGYSRWQNAVVQTAGTSAAQTAFMCVLLGAFDMLRDMPEVGFELDLPWWKAAIWLWVAGTLGVLMAVPLRKHFIVDEKLPYPDGIATAETLIVLDPPRGAGADPKKIETAKRAAMALGVGLLISAFFMVIRDEAKMFHGILEDGWMAMWVVGGVTLAKMGVGLSYSVLAIGSGMIVGWRVNASMILGGVLAWVVAPPLLIEYGVLPPTAKRNDVLLYFVMWPATGMLVFSGLTALALRWRIFIDTFKSLRGAKLDGADFPLTWVGTGVVVMAIALTVIQKVLLDMPVWMTLVAILLSVPLMLVGLRVLGETNWGPISALSNMMQGLFALVAPGHVTANMVSSGTTGTVAVSSEAIIQDYKGGYIIGSTPRALTWAQLMAVPIGALSVSLMYEQLVKTYGKVGGDTLSSAISTKWAGFAKILKDGVSALPNAAIWALVIASVVGVILTLLEGKKEWKPYVPSPTGVGIGILVPFVVIATMFVGGIAAAIWKKVDPKTHDPYMIPLASGFIAGEAIVAVLVPVLLALGIGYGS
jgi:putative OPT family oligopeptide transporter